jgi:hypothetical protein
MFNKFPFPQFALTQFGSNKMARHHTQHSAVNGQLYNGVWKSNNFPFCGYVLTSPFVHYVGLRIFFTGLPEEGFVTRPVNLNELGCRIVGEINAMLLHVVDNAKNRAKDCNDFDGRHLSGIIFKK